MDKIMIFMLITLGFFIDFILPAALQPWGQLIL